MLNELLGEITVTATVTAVVTEKPAPAGDNSGAAGTDTPQGEPAGDNGGASETVDKRVDTNNVPFNPEFCGNAAKPFYGSGKRSGQWKKRQGVDEAAYDAWYAAELARATTSPGDDDPALNNINTAGAFNNDAGNGQPASDPVPEDCGAFMGWVSAKQAAGLLTQNDIGDAYSQAGVQVTDLFPPNDETTVKNNVAALYQLLVVKAGA
jgi:hypothetical protein